MNFQRKSRLKVFLGLLFFTCLLKANVENISPDAMCNVTWTTTSNSITISGLDAPHVIFKLFNPNWSTNYSCLDNCGNPVTLNGLTTGATYHLSYNLYNANWQPLCDDLVDVVIVPDGGNDKADLNLADLKVPAGGNAGAVVDFSVDIKNAGAAIAAGDYVIGFYLSNDNSLSSDDTEVGVINTGNTPIGTINDVPSAITIPGSFTPGDYYLIGFADINDDIDESNEGNNSISSTFRIDDNSNPGDGCGFFKTYPIEDRQALINTSVEETTDNYIITSKSRSFSLNTLEREVVLTIDKNGNQIDLTDNDNPFVPFESDLNIEVTPDYDIVVSKLDAMNSPEWETTISYQSDVPVGVDIIGVVVRTLAEVHDGFLFAGTIVGNDQTTSTNIFYQVSAKLAPNGDLLQKHFGDLTLLVDGFFSLGGLHISDDGGYLFDIYEQNLLSFLKFDSNGAFLWKTPYTSDLPSNQTAGIKLSPDKKFIYAANRNNLKAILDKVDTETGAKIYKLRLGDIFSASGGFTFEFIEGFIATSDGGVVAGFDYTVPGLSETGYEYGKIDANGDLVWDQSFVDPTRYRDLVPQVETADGGFIFVQPRAENGTEIKVMKITSEGLLDPECGDLNPGTPLDCELSYTLENGTLTIFGDGLNSPNMNIKLFSPSWAVAYSCNNNCGNSITIDNLQNGTYHLSVDLFDAGWSRTCRFLLDIPNNGPIFKKDGYKMLDQYKEIVLENLYPNPASDQLTIEISALENTEMSAQVFDARGALVDSKVLQIHSGQNSIDWNIADLPSGFYQVLFESNTTHAPIRFIKQGL